MSRLILFNKPYGVLTQFTSADGRSTLKDYISLPDIYAAGRLDMDSEGLLILTDDGRLQQRIADPRFKLAKTYWVQVEGIPDSGALQKLAAGLDLGDFVTHPCQVRVMAEPSSLWPRDPPIRYRRAIPTTWLEIELKEGKNRQVRRMTAKIGFPTLRLIRWSIGSWTLANLAPGTWREIASIPDVGCQPQT
ncbi:MAG: pseudouridine synthase [Proteobacteria bacterium]|nr:pseudouridine synthase [Pseudomonadota bacterium]